MSRPRRRRPLGALFTALALITGSLWGKPMWGAYWVWDARLTSFLLLFFLYLGYMALWNAIEDEIARRARRRDPGAGRRGQSADHQILGRLVEHAASGREHLRQGRAADRAGVPVAAVPDGGGLHVPVLRAVAGAHPHRNPRPPRARAAAAGRWMHELRAFFAMGGYAAYVWPAYGASLVGPWRLR